MDFKLINSVDVKIRNYFFITDTIRSERLQIKNKKYYHILFKWQAWAMRSTF